MSFCTLRHKLSTDKNTSMNMLSLTSMRQGLFASDVAAALACVTENDLDCAIITLSICYISLMEKHAIEKQVTEEQVDCKVTDLDCDWDPPDHCPSTKFLSKNSSSDDLGKPKAPDKLLLRTRARISTGSTFPTSFHTTSSGSANFPDADLEGYLDPTDNYNFHNDDNLECHLDPTTYSFNDDDL